MGLSSPAFHKHHSCLGKCGLPAGLLPDSGRRGARYLCWSGVEGSGRRRLKCKHLGLVGGKPEGTRVGCPRWLSGKVFGRKGSAAQVVVGGLRGQGHRSGKQKLPHPHHRLPPGLSQWPPALRGQTLQASAEISQGEASPAGPSALRCPPRSGVSGRCRGFFSP